MSTRTNSPHEPWSLISLPARGGARAEKYYVETNPPTRARCERPRDKRGNSGHFNQSLVSTHTLSTTTRIRVLAGTKNAFFLTVSNNS